MSQVIWDTINPNTTSGTQLAQILDDFKNAVVSGFSGSTRPANLQANGYWIDDSQVGSNILVYKFYDGTNDITVFTINTSTQTIQLPGVESTFEIKRISDDAVGATLNLIKERIAGSGQTLTNDVLGKVDFQGTDDGGINYVSSRIIVDALDDFVAAQTGSRMRFFVTSVDTNALAEVMTLLGNKRLGLGTDTPLSTMHIQGTDSTLAFRGTIVEDSTNGSKLILEKKRSTGSGQVLSGDKIGEMYFRSTDQNGAEIDVAYIYAEATENHTDVAQGTKLVIQTKKDGEVAFSTAIEVGGDGNVTIAGQAQNDTKQTLTMVGGTANDLFTIDSTVYKAFEATIIAFGSDAATEQRGNKTKLVGVYDTVNTTWQISEDVDSLGYNDQAIDMNITNAATLDVNYDNNVPSFDNGKIYMEVKRYLA